MVTGGLATSRIVRQPFTADSPGNAVSGTVGTGAAEIERCRVEPDPGACERTLLRDERETLIAFALAGRFRSRS